MRKAVPLAFTTGWKPCKSGSCQSGRHVLYVERGKIGELKVVVIMNYSTILIQFPAPNLFARTFS
jgi:hypothetical protein